MTRINPMDLSFLLLEKANRPFHMAAFMIFQKPKGQQSSFGPRSQRDRNVNQTTRRTQ